MKTNDKGTSTTEQPTAHAAKANPFAKGSDTAKQLSAAFSAAAESKKAAPIASAVKTSLKSEESAPVNHSRANTMVISNVYKPTQEMIDSNIKGTVVCHFLQCNKVGAAGKATNKAPHLIPHSNAFNDDEEWKKEFGVLHVGRLKNPKSDFTNPQCFESPEKCNCTCIVLDMPIEDVDGTETINNFMKKMNDTSTTLYQSLKKEEACKKFPTFKIGTTTIMTTATKDMTPVFHLLVKDDLFCVMGEVIGDLSAVFSEAARNACEVTKDILTLYFGHDCESIIQEVIQQCVMCEKLANNPSGVLF